MRSNQSSFITDIALDPLDNEQEDLLGFENFAQWIADEAMNITSLESVVFGINGEWGEGKTSMINLICKKLKEKEYSFVDFHPWKTNSERAVTQLFFDVLKEGLKGKIAGINWKINSYAEALLNLDQSGFGKTLWQLFFPSDSVEKQKEKLAKSMRLLDKNLIVIVDDLDRLAKNEISDVLKLMRDTANFPNLVFIAAYDRYYLNEAIKSEINPYKAKTYMDKIVLWETQIYKPQPRRYLSVLRNYLKVSLNDYSEVIDEICQIEQDKILKAIHDSSRIKNSEPKNIENIETPYDIHSSIFTKKRTVKKFVNDFVFNFRIVKDNIVFKDFYYLFLLHYFFPDYYTEFVKCFHELYRNNNGYPGKINTKSIEYWNLMKLSSKLKIESSSPLPKEIISNILDPSVHISPNSIIYYQNFPIYFHFGNYDDVTMSEFASLLKADNYQVFKSKVEIILKDKKIISQFAYQLIVDAHRSNFEFKSANSYLEFFKELIWLAIKIDDSVFYQECHRRIGIICNDKMIDLKRIQTDLNEFIIQENIQTEVQYFLYLIIDGIYENSSMQKVSYIAFKDASEIAKENFKSHIAKYDGISNETINLFYCSYKQINQNNKTIYDNIVIDMMKGKVAEHPSDFIKFIVVQEGTWPHSSDPIKKYYQRFADFLLKIFKDSQTFLNFLKEADFKEETNRVKVYLKYAAKEAFEKDDLSQIGSFLPNDKDYTEFFAGSFTQNQLLDWKLIGKLHSKPE
ncbi:MAG TPA: P-loop NTPase fold protein [Paludibacter sp.]